MTDTIFNLIVILIPVAIVIGRIVMGARNKRNPPPKPAQPHIPVHFEDDENYFKRQLSAKQPESRPHVPTPPPKLATLATNEAYLPAAGSGVKSAPGRPTAVAPSGHKDFTLSHLSPLKQAVVMAEILGPPKAME
ncbi:MAG: hypothetical protein LBQ94_12930 [Treponema sp.]|jgi:hypothetical protein|nr:hypothetical protein [Treponema sp.]